MSAATRTLPSGRGSRLAGTGVLLRFMLRRDRVRLPAWVLGMTVMMAYFANAIGTLMDGENLAGLAGFAANPIMALIGGPGYGFDEITVPRFLAGMYGAYLMLGAAFMSFTTVSRHTRVEEQTGRAELVRANVTGRHAPLTAALILTVGMNLAMSLLMGLVLIGSAVDPAPEPAPSFLFALSIGAAGLVFAGVAAVTVQLSPFSRAASSMAGGVLGVAFVVRGLGDMSAVQGGNLDWLSWLSPLGWSQQTAPFTLDRWWPLLLSAGLAAGLMATGYALQARRDLGAGLLADRPGAAYAAAWLRGPVSLAFRLQRSALIGWSMAMLLAGATFGAFVQPMREGAEEMPEEIVALMGGADGIVEGYLGFMGLYFAMMVAAYAIISLQGLRSEEQGMRAEPVLATGVSRPAWLLSWTGVTAAGAVLLLGLAGIGEGLGAALSTGDWGLMAPTVLGHLAHAPAVWLLLGLAVFLYGAFPRLLGAVWAVFVYGVFMSLFGQMLDTPEAVLNTSPFQHIGQYPAEDLSWVAIGGFAGVFVLLSALGTAAFRRRDLSTA
ncbi:ABC transporter permease [Sediminivirga luteola]|uniref:Exporter of polyketide antibiotics n=1 Tax=Sediminivirga luteola TaxID=1774748 RepID=A0A8J2U0G3_9MICO|nr:ABC transporter permease [Sediminivirga luteola]GGA25343.1 exporter of polyketide antibiotics [Sediminivirga luteola]